jgi:hypothetical protein
MLKLLKGRGKSSHLKPSQNELQKSYTCKRCSLLWPTLASRNREATALASETKAELLKSTCRVCCLLAEAMPGYLMENPTVVKPQSVRLRMRPDPDGGGLIEFQGAGFIRGPLDAREPLITVHHKEEAYLIRKFYPKSDREYPPRVDFDLVKRWVSNCSSSHSECKSDMQRRLQGPRVIDCTMRTVIEAPVDCQFVALSYVWSGQHFVAKLRGAALPVRVPRTIEDSITATQLLGTDSSGLTNLLVRRFKLKSH